MRRLSILGSTGSVGTQTLAVVAQNPERFSVEALAAGKKVALFGLGDQLEFPNSFLDAMGALYAKALERGATIVGAWPTDGFNFKKSAAVVAGRFVGLAIDEDQQKDMTEQRVAAWVKQIKPELA